MTRALFITCHTDGLKNAGSARIRATWVARHWKGAAVYDGTQRLDGYDLYVFQKAYLTQASRGMIASLADRRDRGERLLLAFDLCDPDFLSEEHRRRILDILPRFDFAVGATDLLTDYLSRYLPAYTIPDRVDLDNLPASYIPTDNHPPRLVWAGYEGHVGALEVMEEEIHELGLPLDTILLRQSVPFREFWGWVTTRDVLLNPRPEMGKYQFKSDNKTHIAWAMGMPVARKPEDLRGLVDPDARRQESERCRAWAQRNADVRLSVIEWENIFKETVG